MSNPLLVFGYDFGVFDGFDDVDTLVFSFYDVVPHPGAPRAVFNGASKIDCLTVDYEKGTLTGQFVTAEGAWEIEVKASLILSRAETRNISPDEARAAKAEGEGV